MNFPRNTICQHKETGQIFLCMGLSMLGNVLVEYNYVERIKLSYQKWISKKSLIKICSL